jgi:hypothetical protein
VHPDVLPLLAVGDEVPPPPPSNGTLTAYPLNAHPPPPHEVKHRYISPVPDEYTSPVSLSVTAQLYDVKVDPYAHAPPAGLFTLDSVQSISNIASYTDLTVMQSTSYGVPLTPRK